jgi:hypothetical protein
MLSITEYANALIFASGAPIPAEPNFGTQTVDIKSTNQQSEPFGPAVRFIRIHTDRDCAIKFGPSPEASPADTRMSANAVEVFAVQPGHRVSVIAIGEGRDMEGLALLRVLADPQAAQARAEELGAPTAAANKAAAEAKAAAAEVEHARAEVAARETALAQQAEALAIAQQKLDADTANLADNREALDGRIAVAEIENQRMTDFEKRLAAREDELENRERAFANRETKLAAREDALKVSEAGYANRMARLKELAGGAQCDREINSASEVYRPDADR